MYDQNIKAFRVSVLYLLFKQGNTNFKQFGQNPISLDAPKGQFPSCIAAILGT